MTNKEMLKKIKELTSKIQALHKKFIVNSITFDEIGNFSMNFCRVHTHSDDSWTVEYSPNGMYKQGEVSISSYGLLVFKFNENTDMDDLILKTFENIKNVYKQIKKACSELDIKKLESEKNQKIKDLESEIERLKK